MYKKRYNINTLKEIFLSISKDNRSYLSISEILDLIGYEPLDIQEYFIKNIKHKFRYDKNI